MPASADTTPDPTHGDEQYRAAAPHQHDTDRYDRALNRLRDGILTADHETFDHFIERPDDDELLSTIEDAREQKPLTERGCSIVINVFHALAEGDDYSDDAEVELDRYRPGERVPLCYFCNDDYEEWVATSLELGNSFPICEPCFWNKDLDIDYVIAPTDTFNPFLDGFDENTKTTDVIVRFAVTTETGPDGPDDGDEEGLRQFVAPYELIETEQPGAGAYIGICEGEFVLEPGDDVFEIVTEEVNETLSLRDGLEVQRDDIIDVR